MNAMLIQYARRFVSHDRVEMQNGTNDDVQNSSGDCYNGNKWTVGDAPEACYVLVSSNVACSPANNGFTTSAAA